MKNGKLINKKHRELDFVNVPTNRDVELFLDPTKVNSKFLHPVFKDAAKKVHFFFIEVYRVYIEEGRSAVRRLLRYSSECNFIHFGYSKNNSRGTGASEQMLFDFFEKIIDFGIKERENLLHPASIAIFVPKFAEDRTSDLLVSILKKEIIDYSLAQADGHHLKIEKSDFDFGYYWDIETISWKKIRSHYVSDKKGRPLLWVPKCIVSIKYNFSTANFVKNIIFPVKRTLDKYQKINGYFKNGKPKPATQKQLIEREIQIPYINLQDKWKTYALAELIANQDLFNEYYYNMNSFSDNHIIPDEVLDEITDI